MDLEVDDNGAVDVDAILDEGANGTDELEIEDGEILDEIIQDNEILTEKAGPKLHPKIFTIVSGFMGNATIHSSTTDKLKGVMLPEGADFLKPTKVNDTIYPLLPQRLKRENSDLLKVESALTKSTIIQCQVMEKLLEIRNLLPAGQAGGMKSLIKSLADSIEILSFSRSKLNSVRRDCIVGSLNPQFKTLTTATSPGDGLLFGNDLSDVLKEMESSHKMTTRLSSAQPCSSGQARQTSFLGRGQASSNRFKDNNRFRRNQQGWRGRQRSPSPKRPRTMFQRGSR